MNVLSFSHRIASTAGAAHFKPAQIAAIRF